MDGDGTIDAFGGRSKGCSNASAAGCQTAASTVPWIACLLVSVGGLVLLQLNVGAFSAAVASGLGAVGGLVSPGGTAADRIASSLERLHLAALILLVLAAGLSVVGTASQVALGSPGGAVRCGAARRCVVRWAALAYACCVCCGAQQHSWGQVDCWRDERLHTPLQPAARAVDPYTLNNFNHQAAEAEPPHRAEPSSGPAPASQPPSPPSPGCSASAPPRCFASTEPS